MKESYELILEKLKRDRENIDKDIKEVIDEVDASDTKWDIIIVYLVEGNIVMN